MKVQVEVGHIKEILVDGRGNHSIKVTCPPGVIPSAGQYSLAWSQSDPDAVLGIPLFLARVEQDGFLSAAGTPEYWQPGTQLALRGPLGRGFTLRDDIKNLILVAMGIVIDRLLPVVEHGLEHNVAVALFTDCHLPNTSSALEVSPLQDLPGAIDWAELLCIDIPLDRLPILRDILGLKYGSQLPCPAEALIFAPVPCAGLADCGVCAVPARRQWKFACKDGPVFKLDQIQW